MPKKIYLKHLELEIKCSYKILSLTIQSVCLSQAKSRIQPCFIIIWFILAKIVKKMKDTFLE